jgi:hypothetical protein
MTEADVIRVIREHVEGLFPKTCNACQKVFPNYRDYLLNTERVGVPISYDIELGDLKPKHSSGNFALANCRCGNTLVISSRGMPLTQIWGILYWVKMETHRRGVKTEEVVCYLRDTVERQALG